jgi:heptosyltransferase II
MVPEISKGYPMKILCLCLPGMGDCLMFTPTLMLLRKKYPHATIDALTMMKSCQDVLRPNPNLDHVLYYPLMDDRIGGLKFLLGIRGKYDLSIMAFPQYRKEYHIASYVIGSKKRIGHRWKTGHFTEMHFLNSRTIPVDEQQHNVINNLNLLKSLGINWKNHLSEKNIHYELFIDKESKRKAHQYLHKHHLSTKKMLIAIHPGSTPSPAGLLRRWPVERYAQVSDYLIKNFNAQILIFAGAAEQEDAQRLFHHIQEKKHATLVKGISTLECCELIHHTKLVITNDNGFGHIAAALDIPLITLWDSTNPTWTLPRGKKVILHKTKQKPWHRYELKRAVVGDCKINQIQVRDVIKSANKILQHKAIH